MFASVSLLLSLSQGPPERPDPLDLRLRQAQWEPRELRKAIAGTLEPLGVAFVVAPSLQGTVQARGGMGISLRSLFTEALAPVHGTVTSRNERVFFGRLFLDSGAAQGPGTEIRNLEAELVDATTFYRALGHRSGMRLRGSVPSPTLIDLSVRGTTVREAMRQAAHRLNLRLRVQGSDFELSPNQAR